MGEQTGQMGDFARRLLAFSFAFLLVFTALPGTAWTAQVDPAVTPNEVALIQVAHGTSAAVADRARAAGASDVTALTAIDVVTGRLSANATRVLAADSRVLFVAADGGVTSAGRRYEFEENTGADSPWVEAIGANKAWPRATGKGVTVALMDTGIAVHPDLEGSVIARLDFVNDGATEPDPCGHGTFVAGLIAAHGKTFSGVAPAAKLVSLRVLDERGNGSMHSVLAAFDWLLKNREAYRIRVLNLSFGARQTASYHRELLAGVVESAWFAGITVVAAAGNDGPDVGSVSNPGADPFVITAGSLDDRGTKASGDDRESRFSGRGPTLDGFIKPDVLAPGEHVVSLRVPGTVLDRQSRRGQGRDQRNQTLPSDYGRLTGTSASSALVAGVAALVLEEHRFYRPAQVKGALIADARKVTGTRTPAIDAEASLIARPARVNVGVSPSRVLLLVLMENGQLPPDVDWAGISWEGISWEGVTWEGVTWEAVSWESVTWESVTWESYR